MSNFISEQFFVVLYSMTESNLNKKDLQEKIGIDITFSNIFYTVQIPEHSEGFQLPCTKIMKDKNILNGMTGIFPNGELSAIMGASGAGKTTLLNVIAGRISKFDGQLQANSQQYNSQNFGDFANYVMQNDILMQTLTVRETLQFAVRFKYTDEQVAEQKIESLIKKMKLEKCLDVLVGGSMIKGISGGQKKRTSIAFELISDPQVIVLDEPTSGLDSLTSFIIISELKRLAKVEGKTIFFTIHQPNKQIYELFDNLTLLVEGKIIYQGAADQAIDYFSDNFNLTCPKFQNPADYFMGIIHHQDPENVNRYPKYFESYDSKIKDKIEKQIDNRSKSTFPKRKSELSLITSFKTLLKRDWVNSTRNPLILQARLFLNIFMSIFIGGIAFNAGRQDYTNKEKWNAIAGILFFLAINGFFEAMMPITLVFPLERMVFLKEQNSKMYGVAPYFLSRSLIQLPFTLLLPLITTLIVYWMFGLSSTAQQFFTFYLTLFLLGFTASSIGLFLGSLISDPKLVSSIVPLMAMPIILFSGFFKNDGSLPDWIGWIQYISPIKYSFSAIIQNECLHKQSLIDNLNLNVGLWASIGILLGLGIVCRCGALLFLWLFKQKVE